MGFSFLSFHSIECVLSSGQKSRGYIKLFNSLLNNWFVSWTSDPITSHKYQPLKMRMESVGSADANLTRQKRDWQVLSFGLCEWCMFSSEISPVTDLWGQAFRRLKISSGEGKTVFYWGQIKYLVNGFTFLSGRKKQKIIPLAVLTANTHWARPHCILFIHGGEWLSCLECQGDLSGFELN